MTNYIGFINKMQAKIAEPLEYNFSLFDIEGVIQAPVSINQFLGKQLSLEFTGKITCISCNKLIKKSYNQGYCFPCVQKLASCDLCILKPETCHYDKGTCREPDWGLANCHNAHIVYLANSSGIKVGLTRETQIPTRWIDQGAVQALPILRVQTRKQAGLIEVAIAKNISDKTDWRRMLQAAPPKIDLAKQRDELIANLAHEIQHIAANFKFGDIEILTKEDTVELNYPVLEYPTKIQPLSFEKTPLISSVLKGIKGQYLIFESGVINLRKYTGYEVRIAG